MVGIWQNLKTRGTPPVTQDGNAPPTQYSLESYLDRQPRSPPRSYPIPNTSLQNVPDAAFISYSIQSVEEKKEFLEITRNTLDILSSILNSEVVSESLKVRIISFLFIYLINHCFNPNFRFCFLNATVAAVVIIIIIVLVIIDCLAGLA